MIVIDASATVEMLLATEAGLRIAARALESKVVLHAPHLLDVEVAHVLRRLVRTKIIDADRAEAAFANFVGLRVTRHAHLLLLPRVWELRHTVSAYDATYVSLAETLGVPLLTRDDRLAGAHGHRARLEVI